MKQRSYSTTYSEFAPTESNQTNSELPKSKKIIYQSDLDLVVQKPDSAIYKIGLIAKQNGGYVSKAGTYQNLIRVKSENLDKAILEISELGDVQRKTISGEDVTDQYIDFEIRLDNAEKSRKRYLELLAKAENVEAALKVEKELERVNQNIDLLKGKMNKIDHLSEYATISVNVKEKKKPGILGYVGLGLYYSVKWLFVRN